MFENECGWVIPIRPNERDDGVPVFGFFAVNADEGIPGLQACLSGRGDWISISTGARRFLVTDCAIRNRGNCERGRGHPETNKRDRKQHDGDEEINGGPACHHDDFLPPRLAIEEPIKILWLHVLVFDFASLAGPLGKKPGIAVTHLIVPINRGCGMLRVRRQHADNLDESAQRNGFNAVLCFAFTHRPERGPKADEELGDFHPKLLRWPHVSHFVERNGYSDADDENDDTDRIEQ